MTVSVSPLSPSQIETFFEQGFVRINQVFTPEEMDEIDALFESLYATAEQVAATGERICGSNGDTVSHGGSRFTFNSGSSFVRHIAYCGNVEPGLLRFGRDPRLLAIAAALLDSNEFDQMINQAHYKRPGSAVAFDWHQDIIHRGIRSGNFQDVTGKGSYVQMALAVDDATSDNGPLEFIAGSNKQGIFGDDIAQKIDMSKRVTPLLKRGDVVAFGPYTVHGSEANVSQKARRVFINGFAYPGANLRKFDFPLAGERVTYNPAK